MVTNTGNDDNTKAQGHMVGASNSSIEQVATTGGTVVNGTTAFENETKVQSQKYNADYISTQILPVRDQTISDFLAKPQLIHSGHWDSSQLTMSLLQTIPISSYIESTAIWKNKVDGFALVRGTAILRIVINANPFQQGKLLLSFVPLGEDDEQYNFRFTCRCAATQCPNVEIDCRDSSGVMDIPYISPTEYCLRTTTFAGTPKFGWGTARLFVLAPLLVGSGGDNSVDYSIYLSFENFEMAAPTFPQSSGSVSGGPRPKKSAAVSTRTEAAGVAYGKPVSSALMMASKVAGALAGIPAVSSLAAPASWMARGAAGVASWFGWSKPLDDRAPTKVSRINMPGMANATGVSGAANLGLYHDTSLQVLESMAGNDYDEMSFNYLKTRKAFIGEFDWSTSNESNDLLWTGYSSCAYGETFTLASGDEVLYCPPYSYLAKYFSLWRGSVVLTFKIVKTDFHSGRITVTYVPQSNSVSVPSPDSSTYLMREVIDIRSQSEFTLTLPYLLAQQYSSPAEVAGSLFITVLNELKAPTTVSGSIKFLVYASAGDDFELAGPGNPFRAELPLVPQIGGVEPEVDQVIVDHVVGGYSISSHNMVPSSQCVGEMFTSVKQLLTKYTALVTPIDIVSTSASIAIYPYAIQLCNVSAGGVVQMPFIFDALSLFAPGYALYRGRVKILDSPDFVGGDVVVPMEASLQMLREPNGVPTLQVDTDFVSSFANRFNILTNSLDDFSSNTIQARQIFDPINGLEVSVPYYCPTRMSRVGGSSYTGTISPGGQIDEPKVQLRIQRKATKELFVHKLFRACADDFQLAYFLGFPPIWYTKPV